MSAIETAGPGPGYARKPGHLVRFEPTPKRIRAELGGETVFDTTRAQILFETGYVPVYYVPREDAATDLFTKTDETTHCPFKGDATYYTVSAGGKGAENAAWSYERPFDEVAGIGGYLAFYWNRLDRWFEEDEEVFVHARSPYVRVDILDCARPVRVELAGQTVAETGRARLLFETGLPVRHYLPRADVTARLIPSDLQTRCPYKGTASYFHVEAGGEVFENLVWTYPDPIPESARIADYLCFFDEKVDAVSVGGETRDKPKTKWS